MDFELNEQQRILKESAHDFLMKECPKSLVRELQDSALGYSPELWKKMAELGWMGVIVPEQYEGIGGSFMDLTVILEEMGYNVCPSPFVSTTVLGGLLVQAAGSEKQKSEFLPKIARGELKLTLALAEHGAVYEASAIKDVQASSESNGQIAINGTKMFVPDANIADVCFCVARTAEKKNPEEGLTVFILDPSAPGIKSTLLKTMARERMCEMEFKDVRATEKDILGSTDKAWPAVKDVLEKATLAQCAEMVGGEQWVMDMALQYAKERTQFNRAIGSFQAIQHHFANMWVDIFGSRHLLYKAAWKVSEEGRAAREIAMAKAHIGAAYRRVTTLGHQIFAAVGFTLEHDMHFYHKRSVSGDQVYGNSSIQREYVARELGL
jgi:alkylation response protein AidB-like acyl-CoA dehydrogenase